MISRFGNGSKVPFHRRLGFRLPLLLAGMVLAGSLIGALAAIHATERQFRAMLDEQFRFALETTENLFDLVGQMGLIWAGHFTHEQALVEAVSTGNSVFLARFGSELLADSSADLLVVLDERGRVLFRNHRSINVGDSLLYLKLVRDTLLDGEVGSTVVQQADNFVVYSSALVRDGVGKRIGALLVGYLINDRFLAGVSKNTRVDVTVVRRRAVMASTFNDENRRLASVPLPYTQYQMLLAKQWRVSKLRLEGVEHFAAARPLRLMEPSMEGSVLVTYPADELERTTAELRAQFLWSSLGAVLLVMVFGTRAAHRMLAPMRRLVEDARREAEGGGEETVAPPRLKIKSRDEAGVLADEFNRLLSRIHDQRNELRAWGSRLELEVAERTRELEQSNRRLAELSVTDQLTQLYNRAKLDQTLLHEVSRAERYGHGFGLILLDVDHFKQVNDSYGHQVGDQVLVAVAGLLAGHIRAMDILGRWGGEEFLIVCPNTDLEGVGALAEHLRARLAEQSMPTVGTKTASFGAAAWRAGDSVESLVARADQALYAAKEGGRNRVEAR